MAEKPKPAAPPSTGDLKEWFAQEMAKAGQGGGGNFIGFPAGKTSLVGVAPGTVEHAQPLYGEGSQLLPVLSNATPQDIEKLQQRLIDAGLLDTDYRRGVWDPPSQQAFTQVLGLANASGTAWQDALKNYEDGTPMTWDAKTNSYVKGTAGTARTRAPLVTRYTNPDDLATAAQEVATSKLGRSFTPEELQRFVNAYHSTEGSSQASAHGAGASGGGYTDAPSVQTAADTFAKQADPTAYNAEQFLPLVEKMNEMLSGPGFDTTRPMEA